MPADDTPSPTRGAIMWWLRIAVPWGFLIGLVGRGEGERVRGGERGKEPNQTIPNQTKPNDTKPNQTKPDRIKGRTGPTKEPVSFTLKTSFSLNMIFCCCPPPFNKGILAAPPAKQAKFQRQKSKAKVKSRKESIENQTTALLSPH